jgi:hypothetical protein
LRSQSFVEIALAVRQAADLGGQQNAFGGNSGDNITDSELQYKIWASTARLWGKIVQNFPENYFFRTYFINTTGGTYSYQLPYDFMKELKVGVQLAPGSNVFLDILPYNLHEQDHYNYLPGIYAPVSGLTTLRYQAQEQNMVFQPQTGVLPAQVRVQYIPCAPFLCPNVPTAWAATTAYTQGALVSSNVTNSGVVTSQTFIALNAGTSGGSLPAWNVPGTVNDNGITWAYKGPTALFQTTFDGINGWEDWIVLDCAIKCSVKQESSVIQEMMAQLAQLDEAIMIESANRQAADPHTVTGGWGMREGGAFGGGWGDMGGMGWG